MQTLLNILTAALTLFAVIDMVGNVPLIIKLRKTHGEIESLKGTIIAACIMISTLFVGTTVFNLLGIETFHFGLAGSFLILYFGVKMVLGIDDNGQQKKEAMKATIFPVAFPLISGPGTLSTIMSLTGEFSRFEIVVAIVLNSLVIYLVLKSADWIKKKMGTTGITIMERVFGIILIAIGMKILLQNLLLSIQYANSVINGI
jgi:multiple antibiotic resistance protein